MQPTEEQTYREGVKEDLHEIKELVKFTNGKVKKIIMALIAITFFSIGVGLKDLAPLLKVILSL